jgi:hypothetical protein
VNDNLPRIQQLVKKIGMQITKADIEKNFVESLDFRIQVKEKLVANLNQAILESNNLILSEIDPKKIPSYKFFVEKGNNSLLVRSILKERQ